MTWRKLPAKEKISFHKQRFFMTHMKQGKIGLSILTQSHHAKDMPQFHQLSDRYICNQPSPTSTSTPSLLYGEHTAIPQVNYFWIGVKNQTVTFSLKHNQTCVDCVHCTVNEDEHKNIFVFWIHRTADFFKHLKIFLKILDCILGSANKVDCRLSHKTDVKSFLFSVFRFLYPSFLREEMISYAKYGQ